MTLSLSSRLLKLDSFLASKLSLSSGLIDAEPQIGRRKWEDKGNGQATGTGMGDLSIY